MPRKKSIKLKAPSRRTINKIYNGMSKAGDILTKAGGIGAAIGPATGAAAPFIEAGSAGAIAVGQGLKGASSIGRSIYS